MMDIISTEGIIFRTLKYAETSIICDIFTKERGLKSYIVSGVRKSGKNATGTLYQVGNIVMITAYDGTDDKLQRIKEIHLAHHYQQIGIHVIKSSIILFMMEVCRNSIKEKEENVVLFDFIKNYLLYVDEVGKPPSCVLHLYLIELSYMLGFGPSVDDFSEGLRFDLLNGEFSHDFTSHYLVSAAESAALYKIIGSDISNIDQIQIKNQMRVELLDHLLMYFRLHVPTFTESQAIRVIRQVFG